MEGLQLLSNEEKKKIHNTGSIWKEHRILGVVHVIPLSNLLPTTASILCIHWLQLGGTQCQQAGKCHVQTGKNQATH